MDNEGLALLGNDLTEIAALTQKLECRVKEVEAWRTNFQVLDKNYDELEAEYEAYKVGNYDPAESIRLNGEVVRLKEDNFALNHLITVILGDYRLDSLKKIESGGD